MTIQERIKNRKIGIVGMARSGMAAAKLLDANGGEVFVSDSGKAERLVEQVEWLRANGIKYETDGHSEELLECDYLVLSPGVPPDISILQKAAEAGLPMFSEIEVASWLCRGRIVAVTGSNGKTTTTTLLGEIFAAAGFDCFVCGNIGKPFSEVAAMIPDRGLAVVEVSTFQLERIEDFRPYAAAILNLTPDHLDRHGSFEVYKQLKYRITENQTGEDFLVLNTDDREMMGDDIKSKAARLMFSTSNPVAQGAFVRDGVLYSSFGGREEAVISVDEIVLPGPHNLQNAAAATAMAVALGVGSESIAKVLSSFGGVEHRLEQLGSVAGINFVNDSKATNVDSVFWALRSMETPVYLIVGGRDKGAGYQPIIEAGTGKIKGIVAIGEAKEKIFDQLGQSFPVQFASSLEEAVLVTFEQAAPGETVLLSPGCASFDMFEDFEQRGLAFKQAVAGLKHGKGKNETITG